MPERNFKRSLTATTPGEYSEQLSLLAEKISSIRKDISYFDTYNITQSVSDKNQLSAAIAALPPGSALVVNFQDHYMLGGREYKTGDVVLRTINGEEVYISSQVGGTYYPHILSKSENGYELTFSYIESKPQEGDRTAVKNDNNNTWSVDVPAQNITFPVQEAGEVVGAAYSQECMFNYELEMFDGQITTNEYIFEKKEIEGCIIQPLIRFIIKDNDGKMVEELELEYGLATVSNNWVIILDDYPNINFWVVIK